MTVATSPLPQALLARATLRGNEFAWSLDDIPEVIETARRMNLLNIGGQLQFRLPGGGTCECHWVFVNTYLGVPKALGWSERVQKSAQEAIMQFLELPSEHDDFIAEGRKAFEPAFQEAALSEIEIEKSMCFVWMAISEEGEKEIIRFIERRSPLP